MARPIRIEFPGAVYHVMARGNERRRTFRDDEDRRRFLAALEEAVSAHGLVLHGYCLMPNHYHLLVETPRGNLSRTIGWLQTAYSIRFNRRHRRSGHLFQGRFKAQVVEADAYAMELPRYVHLNPVRPRLKTAPVPPERKAALAACAWSSHRAYLGRENAPAWLCTDWLSYFGSGRRPAQRRYGKFVDDAFGDALPSPWDDLQSGVVLGGEALLERVRQLIAAKPKQEKMRWTSRVDGTKERRRAAQDLAAQENDHIWQDWLRVQLGGKRKKRRIDVARARGYSDGSAITHLLRRHADSARRDRKITARQSALQRAHTTLMSSVRSCLR